MSRVADILARAGSDWEPFAAPLPADEISEALQLIGLPLPDALVELYHECNGGEGSLPNQPWNFVLWRIEEVVQIREHEHYRKHYPLWIFFGSSGGGEYFYLDPAGRVFIMDPIAGEESSQMVTESFDEFLKQIGFLPPGGLTAIDEE